MCDMEEEKKKNNVGLIIFLILIILGLAGYICYDKFFSKTDYAIEKENIIGLGLSDKEFFKQSIEKIKTINDITNILFEKLEISKEEKFIRLFFKGRPLLKDENISDISN